MKALNHSLVTLAALGSMLVAPAAMAASSTSNATANVITAISINKTIDLDFGALAPSTTGGSVLINATSGVRTSSGGVTLSSIDAGNRASFNVAGDSSATYAITLPATNVTLTRSGGTETMSVTNFASNPSGTGQLTAGQQVLYVGATLNVGANQAAGSYIGTFDVSVDYN
jgi:hypothetical protein